MDCCSYDSEFPAKLTNGNLPVHLSRHGWLGLKRLNLRDGVAKQRLNF
jgi:hypothetical protein